MQKYAKHLLGMLVCVVLIFLHTPASIAKLQEKQAAGTIDLTPLQAQKLINQRPGLVIIDVRTARERKRRFIKNSLHISLTDVFRGKVEVSVEQPVLLYCAVGGRSAIAVKLLQKKGFKEIYNLAGGIAEWHRQKLPTLSEE